MVEQEPPHIVALVVGVDSYEREDFDDVTGAVGDAKSFADAIRQFWPGAEVIEVIGSPTVAQVNTGLYQVRSATAGLKIFYFSGHGVATNVDSYLCTGDSDVANEGVPLSMLIRQLGSNTSPASWLAVLDCCHSTPTQMRNNYLTKEDIQTSMTGVGASRAVLAACAPNAESVITGDGRSPFTDAVIAGLDGAASNADGNVTVGSLLDFIVSLGEVGLPKPVLVGDLAEGFVLRRGLQPRGTRGLSRQSIDAVSEEASRLVATLHGHIAIGSTRWRENGWADACRTIRPIEHWFTKKAKEQPQLHRNDIFRDAREVLDRIVAYVCNISEGIKTENGVIGQQIGAGGFGTVWTLIRSQQSEPTKALKIYHGSELRNHNKRVRFERGYRAMEQLHHDGIVKVEKYVETPPSIIMELVHGENLRNFTGFLDDTAKLHFMIEVCKIIQYAHSRNVIHRDIKPENIIVATGEQAPRPVLTDFDLAWFTTATEVTRDGMGHILYAAPEQLHEPEAGTSRAPLADIYSVGQVLFFLLTGDDPKPYNELSNAAYLRDALRKNRSNVGFASEAVVNLYTNTTRVDLSTRTQNVAEIANELLNIVRSQGDTLHDGEISFSAFISQAINRANMTITDSSGNKVYAITREGRIELEIIRNPRNNVPPRNDLQVRLRPRVYSKKRGRRGVEEARDENRRRVNAMIAVDKEVQRHAVSKGFLVAELACTFATYDFDLAMTFGRRLQHLAAAGER